MIITKHFRLIDNIECSAEGTFGSNFDPDKKLIVGHLTGLTFKTDNKEIKLQADFPVRDPENPSGDLIKVVGVLDWIDWGGEATDVFGFIGRVSPKNRGLINEALSSGGGKNMQVEWKIYDYDDEQKTHFICFSNGDAAINMTLDTSQSGVGVADQVELEPADPRNYRFVFFMKAIGQQMLHYASSKSANQQKQAGNALQA